MSIDTEVVRAVRSIKGILEKVPLDRAVKGDRIDINPAALNNVPLYLRNNFKITFRYKENTPYKAACIIYSPKNAVTVYIIINKKYERFFRLNQSNFPSNRYLSEICNRRSLYIHELCHMVAVIRVFPENYDMITRKDFVAKIGKKFGSILEDAENEPLFSYFDINVPPFIFPEDHFNYKGDQLDYNILYQELMISDEEIKETVKKLREERAAGNLNAFPPREWIAIIKQIDPAFFRISPYKKEEFLKELNT